MLTVEIILHILHASIRVALWNIDRFSITNEDIGRPCIKNTIILKPNLFSAHPNTGTFFISHTHKEAWTYLISGIESQEPFLLLTGEYGMGKTLLCFRLLNFLQEKGDHPGRIHPQFQ